MTKKTFSFGNVVSGQIHQLGVVVPDIEAAMSFYVRNLGIGPFVYIQGFMAPDGWYRGETAMPKLSMGHVYTGRVFIELIQQHCDTPSVYTEHVGKYGYGLHHYGIAIAPEDYDRVINGYYTQDFENVFTDNLPSGARIRYIAPKDPAAAVNMVHETGVGYFECVEMVEEEEGFFGGICEAAANWDGKTISINRV
jgi:hypothetical protein